MTADRRCAVCARRDRDVIDAALTAGRPVGNVGRRHHLDRATLRRHAAHVQPVAPVKSTESTETPTGHGAAFLGALRARAAAEGVFVPTAARRWRRTAPFRWSDNGPGAA